MKREIAVLTIGASLGLVGLTGYDVTFAEPLFDQLTKVAQLSLEPLNSSQDCRTQPIWNSNHQAECQAVDRLKNATYHLPKLGKVQLKNGVYVNTTKKQRVVFVDKPEAIALGDFTKDGQKDAAILLTAKTGGSEAFTYLAATTNADKMPNQVGSVLLGDRVKVKSIAIDAKKIKVNLLTRRPKDPPCCPTQPVTQLYALNKNSLTRLPKPTQVKQSGPAEQQVLVHLWQQLSTNLRQSLNC